MGNAPEGERELQVMGGQVHRQPLPSEPHHRTCRFSPPFALHTTYTHKDPNPMPREQFPFSLKTWVPHTQPQPFML